MQRTLLFLLLVLASTGLFAQQIRQVSFADVQDISLDQIIVNDLEAADGESHFIFELARNTPFIFNATLQFDTLHVELRAAEGDGEPPLIFVGVAEGETPSQIFRINGTAELTLGGLYISGESDQGGTFVARHVRTDGSNTRINVYDCDFDQSRQSIFRLSGKDEKLFVYNSRFNRVGQPSNPNNGRFIDHRGDGADSVIIKNCLVSNVTSRWWRTGGGAVANYVEMDNNTFVNSAQNGFSFEEVETLIFTDNIVVNGRIRGGSPAEQRVAEEADYVFTIDTVDQDNDVIVFARNNFFESADYLDAMPELDGRGDSIVSPGAFDRYISPQLQAVAGDDAYFTEVLNFDESATLLEAFVVGIIKDTTGGQDLGDIPAFDISDLMESAFYSGTNLGSSNPVARYVSYYNYCYGEDAASATASATGNSIGGQDSETCDGLTDVEQIIATRDLLVYPNPTKGAVNLYSSSAQELGIVRVYNFTGQLLQEHHNVREQLQIQTADYPAGTYIISVVSPTGNISGRQFVKQ